MLLLDQQAHFGQLTRGQIRVVELRFGIADVPHQGQSKDGSDRKRRESGGGTVALTEDEIVAALRRLARQGLFAEPTSASAAAALDKLSDAGSIKSNETTIVLLTGNGLKAASTVADLVQ